ncbi:hypothetical protein ACFT9M_12370 [Micromonospora purpureochromogenes]|uniref:hypothetical protein n=1 Tax=Micromonospora purpureochromogenes TaxID=47872 RepID=UPI0036320198
MAANSVSTNRATRSQSDAPAWPLAETDGAWHRWTTLVIAAHAFLAAATTVTTSSPDGLLAIPADVIAWSLFRRRQAAAKTSHYTRRALAEP